MSDGELTRSHGANRGLRSRPPLGRRAAENGVDQQRMICIALQTLSLRDPTAARHAAATARTACELAKAAGFSRHEQDITHTAGLLHDLGREALPDSILVAERELEPADHRLVRRHPLDGARLLEDVPELAEVAETIVAHHERPDGQGYPYGLSGRAIPRTARALAIAEVYDVLTAPDSYSCHRTVEEAIAELRRVAGGQLDAQLVETFAEMISRRDAGGLRPRGDSDLEAELGALRLTPTPS